MRLGDKEGEALRSLQIALGDSLANAGRGAESAEVFLRAAEGADTATRMDCQRRAAQQLMATGHLEQGIEALRAVTIDAAWQVFQDDNRGSLEPGKYADLVVLSGNPVDDPMGLRELQVERTLVGGATIYRRQ